MNPSTQPDGGPIVISALLWCKFLTYLQLIKWCRHGVNLGLLEPLESRGPWAVDWFLIQPWLLVMLIYFLALKIVITQIHKPLFAQKSALIPWCPDVHVSVSPQPFGCSLLIWWPCSSVGGGTQHHSDDWGTKWSTVQSNGAETPGSAVHCSLPESRRAPMGSARGDFTSYVFIPTTENRNILWRINDKPSILGFFRFFFFYYCFCSVCDEAQRHLRPADVIVWSLWHKVSNTSQTQ